MNRFFNGTSVLNELQQFMIFITFEQQCNNLNKLTYAKNCPNLLDQLKANMFCIQTRGIIHPANIITYKLNNDRSFLSNNSNPFFFLFVVLFHLIFNPKTVNPKVLHSLIAPDSIARLLLLLLLRLYSQKAVDHDSYTLSRSKIREQNSSLSTFCRYKEGSRVLEWRERRHGQA